MKPQQVAQLIFEMLMRHEGKTLTSSLCHDRANNIAAALSVPDDELPEPCGDCDGTAPHQPPSRGHQ